MCTKTKLAHTLTMNELAKLIGNLVAFNETVPYGKLLFYRHSERDKIKSLRLN